MPRRGREHNVRARAKPLPTHRFAVPVVAPRPPRLDGVAPWISRAVAADRHLSNGALASNLGVTPQVIERARADLG